MWKKHISGEQYCWRWWGRVTLCWYSCWHYSTGPSQETEIIQTWGVRKSLLWRGAFILLSFPASKPGKQSRCHQGHTSCIRTHGLALASGEAHIPGWRPSDVQHFHGILWLSVGHPPHPSPTGPATSEIPWLWLGKTGKNCILWVRIWQKIVLQAACSNMAMYSGTVLAGCSICVSSQHKCPPRLSSGLTDHFLEFHVNYMRRKKLLTGIKSKIIKLSKLEILLFV